MTQPTGTVAGARAQTPKMPISSPENAEIKVYTGDCHYRKVRYEFEHPDIYAMPVMNCNCSICVDRGHLCVYTPSDQFRFAAGKDELTQYEFGNHFVIHRFCSKCGRAV
ncbi:Mss4-like protein [Mycena olivaceomarginata]|nr:Mss4-like protein [Mycena olivaceomarginata]KAJ7830362.1 Mss4-like protein [Mycena olivaceomarginata]